MSLRSHLHSNRGPMLSVPLDTPQSAYPSRLRWATMDQWWKTDAAAFGAASSNVAAVVAATTVLAAFVRRRLASIVLIGWIRWLCTPHRLGGESSGVIIKDAAIVVVVIILGVGGIGRVAIVGVGRIGRVVVVRATGDRRRLPVMGLE